MKNYNNSANPIRVIRNLYDKATSAVLINSSRGDWFQVQQGCLLSPTFFNKFVERTMTDAFEDHKSSDYRTMKTLLFLTRDET